MNICGFRICEAVMLIGLHALDLAMKIAAGTKAEFTSRLGNLGGTVAASAIVGYTVDFFGWEGGVLVVIGRRILAGNLLVGWIIGDKHNHDRTQV
ncbi:hypothetical protein AGE07_24135 [Salmonella enterica subsp. enterica serovar Kentucky]|nr:hypothetical protein AGE07_24135 [Salmonella enterica subsp. enterica serovar Kentucky]